MNTPYIDHTVYPDREALYDLKEDFLSIEEKADYLDRICAAWDFDVRPEHETFLLLRTWKDVFDSFPVLSSPAYHTFRAVFGWSPLEREGGSFFRPLYLRLDQERGRIDPCEGMV